ncbi:MAG: helix-turn-helix domain-containing protein [Limnochordia bacterium]|nr:helix-turn-helix domain-containing protein [Bacillota bacterium]HOB09074.1 helix-turn-helix domain-containing protein [Limnochordia bacterium]NLH30751.1 helix-turn-helix domain-containing protein [Bacillota bacterium]HPT92837.1 helix-turn-helix domain-containing protein [Limnochordia bacterium]HPZ31181.1 helix-turn-helix domain-containing protein [Limnochordia bacterium]
MIGDNIRLRRKKMRLSQEALAKGNWTRSYVSQIERGRILPSLQTLSQIANKLDTTVAELVGDQTTLAKAKASILQPDVCKQYLAQLPKTPTVIFLEQLTNSLLTNNDLDCQLPPNPELYYLTGRVLTFMKKYPQAEEVLQRGVRLFDSLWRMLYLNQLCLIYEQQNDGEALAKAETELEGLAESAHTVQELERQLINELRYEADPVRSAYLAMFIQSVHYGAQFQQILDRFGR